MKKVKPLPKKCPNPLFEKWLIEWRDEARANGSGMEKHFTRAIESLQKYPLPLAMGRDCILLQHFGTKLCAMLDKRLKKHLEGTQEVQSLHTERLDTCNNVGNNISPKEARNFERTVVGKTAELAKKTDFIPREKTNIANSISKKINNQSVNTKENCVIQEPASCSAYGLPEAIENQEKPRTKAVKRRSRVHSLSSSDSDDSRVASIVKKTGSNNIESSTKPHAPILNKEKQVKEKSKVSRKDKKQIQESDIANSQPAQVVANKHDLFKEKRKVARKINEKQIQENNIVDSQLSTKTVEDTDTGVKEQFHLAPGTFDVILLVDIHETGSSKTKSKDGTTMLELDRLKTPYEIRHLNVGDFAWVARCRESQRELVLPYIVERKRMDDLASSIKDGRFHEQKFRLRQSGIQNIIYMIENYGKNQHLGLPLPTCLQAAMNSFVQDGFTVKYTDNNDDSMQYLSFLTTLINRIFKNKHLKSSSKEELDPHCLVSSTVPLMEFKQFNKASSKAKTFKVKEMLIRQLLQIKGVSVEKALAIAEFYPTFTILAEALEKAGKDGEKLLAGIKVGNLNRQLGPVLSKTICDLYTKRIPD